ncbi:MAG: OmpH family outer membrane protein [Arenicellales bacterium]
MVYKRAILFVPALCMMFSGAALAQKSDLKIGFVNVEQVMSKAPQVEVVRKELRKEFDPRDREIRSMQEEVNKLADDLNKNELVLDETSRNKEEMELRDKRRALSRATSEFREDLNLRKNEELSKLQKLVFKAIVEIAKKESYDLVLHEPAVIYASDRIDMTDKVLKKLQDESK